MGAFFFFFTLVTSRLEDCLGECHIWLISMSTQVIERLLLNTSLGGSTVLFSSPCPCSQIHPVVNLAWRSTHHGDGPGDPILRRQSCSCCCCCCWVTGWHLAQNSLTHSNQGGAVLAQIMLCINRHRKVIKAAVFLTADRADKGLQLLAGLSLESSKGTKSRVLWKKRARFYWHITTWLKYSHYCCENHQPFF